jgi:hypothetical protein
MFTTTGSKPPKLLPAPSLPTITHRTRDGRTMTLAEMADDHLLAALPTAYSDTELYINEALTRGLITEAEADRRCPVWRTLLSITIHNERLKGATL